MFAVEEKHLFRLCEVNRYLLPADEMIFFGIRGCLPVLDDDHSFKKSHQAEVVPVDYTHPRCTLGQWMPGEGFALFPGSTVPHRSHVESALRSRSGRRSGEGANQLMTGLFKNYKKGRHPRRKTRTQHDAFRNDGNLPIRRTADDLDYDNDDRVEYMTPNDNLHAAWCPSVDHPKFASAGCQVVVGFPHCPEGSNAPASGPWKVFQENAYGRDQESFSYILMTGRAIRQIGLGDDRLFNARLRFGSRGPLVTKVQKELQKLGHYEGQIDDDFGKRTLFAVLDFQTEVFGDEADDGIVGPMTASALGLKWPEV